MGLPSPNDPLKVRMCKTGGGWTEVGRYNNKFAIVRGLQTGTQYKFHVCALNAKLNPAWRIHSY